MGYRRTPFAVGEWYHCYTRGIDKRDTFESEDDCRRFIQLLYLANSSESVGREYFYYMSHTDILQRSRLTPLVSIGAYCLMKNHYHILIQETVENGISRFMQKLGTGYTMYFNEKYERVGSLFVGPFRSKHINSDPYVRRVTQYIHLNPAEMFEAGWKKGKVKNFAKLERNLLTYQFSSLPDYSGSHRPEKSILDTSAVAFLRDEAPPLREVVRDAADYYAALKL
jgi:REP element-mobilizing transposase RayT